MSTDAQLLQRFTREHADDAFAELVQRHVDLVYSTALRHVGGDAHLARDVTQRVFVSLVRKASVLAQRRSVAGWLYIGAHHAAAEIVRAERRRRTREQKAYAMQEVTSSEVANADWDRVRPVLDGAMRCLGEADREAVLLRFFERQTFAQIADALGLSEDAARMRVGRALEKLRSALARGGVTSTSAALAVALSGQAMVAAPAELAAAISDGALSTAATASTALLSPLSMTTSFAVLTGIAVVAIVGVVHQADKARHAESTVAALIAERDTLQARLRSLSEKTAAATDRPTPKGAAGAEPAEGPGATSRANGNVAAGPAPTSGDSGRVMTISARAPDGTSLGSHSFIDSPEGRREMSRVAAAQTYAALFRKLGWTELQQEMFKNLVADRKEAGQQMFQDAHARGTRPNRELAKQIAEETGRQLDAQLRAEFGEGVVEAMRHFEATKPLRNVADDLAKALFYSEAPLTTIQAESLIDVMSAIARNQHGRIDIAALESEALLQQAQAILSPAQLAALRTVEAERQRQRALQEKLLAERERAGSSR